MSRAPKSLINAVRRAKREDRLTDLVAMVLEEHVGFANRLLGAADLPPAAEVRASPQVTTRHGRHPDLEVVGLDARGAAISRLWSENKTGADYQPEQLPDYAEDIPDRPGRRQLITIVDEIGEVPPDQASPDAPRWLGFTWQQVAVMAWKAGREEAPEAEKADWREAARGWRRCARSGGAPSIQPISGS
ncbi:MAG: PD-(D/E)XK nuclease family protein [Actinomycetota bacterium]|nr:PD-(D/E)XK nuclease family protein [Actinomycetota bacterium]